MQGLLLDDERDIEMCIHVSDSFNFYSQVEWKLVKTYEEFVEYLENNPLPDVISLDHDLAMEHYHEMAKNRGEFFDYDNVKIPTGMDALKFLLQHLQDTGGSCLKLVHTMNPYAKIAMRDMIKRYDEKFNK